MVLYIRYRSIGTDRAVRSKKWRLLWRNASSMPMCGQPPLFSSSAKPGTDCCCQYLSNIKIPQTFLHGFFIIIFSEKGNRANFQQATENIMQPGETQVICNNIFHIFKSGINSNEVLAYQPACCNYWKPRCYRSSKVCLWSPVGMNRVQYDLISSCKQTVNSDSSLRSP